MAEILGDQAHESQSYSTTFDKNKDNLDDKFVDFMATLGNFDAEDLGEYAAKKARTRNVGKFLPGFLYPDGKSRAVEDKADKAEESTVILNYGTSEEEVQRLTDRFFNNSFEILGISVKSNNSDVRKAYKKLSLLVHPDKCSHPRAKEAFDIVSNAYKNLQRPEIVETFRAVHEEAKEKVLAEIATQNKQRTIAKEKLLSTDEDSIRVAVTEMCEKLIKEQKENAEYAERCRKANEEWEKRNAEDNLKIEQKHQEEKRKWEETRDARVEDWREFRGDIESKKIKTCSFRPIQHRREQRKVLDKKVSSKPKGVDESYKQLWR